MTHRLKTRLDAKRPVKQARSDDGSCPGLAEHHLEKFHVSANVIRSLSEEDLTPNI